MSLIRLPLRQGEAIAEAHLTEGSGTVYLCAKDHCPHYQGQLGILASTASMYCALVHYPPDRTCQPYYLEAAEALDHHLHRGPWEQRLEEAEAFEQAIQAASGSPSPGGRECGWERGPGGEGLPPLPEEARAMGKEARG